MLVQITNYSILVQRVTDKLKHLDVVGNQIQYVFVLLNGSRSDCSTRNNILALRSASLHCSEQNEQDEIAIIVPLNLTFFFIFSTFWNYPSFNLVCFLLSFVVVVVVFSFTYSIPPPRSVILTKRKLFNKLRKLQLSLFVQPVIKTKSSTN